MHEGINISIDSRFTAIEDAASGLLLPLFPLLSVCFPSYLQNQFSYFTVLSATPSVKPSLTILAETAPFPHPFLAFCSPLFFSWHVSPCNSVIRIHVFTFDLPPPPDCELSRSSICKSLLTAASQCPEDCRYVTMSVEYTNKATR